MMSATSANVNNIHASEQYGIGIFIIALFKINSYDVFQKLCCMLSRIGIRLQNTVTAIPPSLTHILHCFLHVFILAPSKALLYLVSG